MSGPSLSQVIAVLDRADAQATSDAAQARQRLLNTVMALDTAHSPETLTRAVEEELAQPQATVPVSPLVAVTPYHFGWDRPRTPGELQRKQASWRGRLARFDNGRKVSPLALGVAALTTGLAGWITWGQVHATSHDAGEILVKVMLSLLVFPGVGMLMDLGILPACQRFRKRYEPVILTEDRLGQYLAHPATRAYLHAVIHGPVPDVLAADQARLNALIAAHQAKRARQDQQQQQLEQQQRMKEGLAAQASRLRQQLKTASP